MKRICLALLCAALASCANADPVKHNYDLKNVLWKLSFDISKGTIAGDATNTLTLAEDSATAELACSELDVSKVWVDGTPAQFTSKDDKLTVALPIPGKAGQTLA